MFICILIVFIVIIAMASAIWFGLKIAYRDDPRSRIVHTTESNIEIKKPVSFDIERMR